MTLTPRQIEVAALVAQGLTTKEVARQLRVSYRTADMHIRQAAARLGGTAPPRHRLTLWFISLHDRAA